MKPFFFLLMVVLSTQLLAQDAPINRQKRIFFPHPMTRNWQVSIGFISTTMPTEITEEAHFRVPALDLHLIRKLTKKIHLDARLNSQLVQNLATLGPRWTTSLSKRLCMGLGDDLGYWFGRIDVAGIRTKGSGFLNRPNLSLGYHFNKRILLTLRGESLMNFGVQTTAGETPVESKYNLFSGSAYSIILEQPFAGSKSMTLGFRAIYTDYFWQTWTLFENYDRKLFFPQIIVGLIL